MSSPVLRLVILGVGAALAVGCRTERASKPLGTSPPLARGDRVVVERAAADFFEARVLSVSKETLKVQTSTEGDPVVVASSDAYPVRVSPHSFGPGEAAICRSAPSTWEACRIVKSGTPSLVVELATGEERSLDRDALLVPGPVTVLGIERHFEILDTRQRFAKTARAAGNPRRPGGWTPAPHEPVLARKGSEWYLAHAAQLLADGGENVVWDGTNRSEPLPGAYVVPAPPFEHTFARGDFALSRPSTPGAAWERVSIEAIGPDGAMIVGASGERRRVDGRTLVPLSNNLPSPIPHSN